MPILSAPSGGAPDPDLPDVAPGACPACGHDPADAMRQLVSERHEAWLAGRRLAQDALEAAELRGHAAGQQGLAAGRERAEG